MPFSFIEIEKEKSRVIAFVFLALILFYFVTAYLLLIVIEQSFIFHLFFPERGSGFFSPPPGHLVVTLLLAFGIASAHWFVSVSGLIQKLTQAAGAVPIDPDDTYHQTFKNIVDEVSAAIGGRSIEPWVISSYSMNAFALEDFEGRAVIGVTEGLLARLNRAQIEAVVGHEAGHIVCGDCLATTVSCALAEIYQESLSGVKDGLRYFRGRGFLIFIPAIILLVLLGFLNTLLRCFISRQREFRADAVGVRLTRDPLSLAEALKLITRHWRGEGVGGENLQSIFIVNPRYDALDEEEGVLPDFFSTHPPVRKRIAVLLSMAHMDEQALEEHLKNFKRASPVVIPVAEKPRADDLKHSKGALPAAAPESASGDPTVTKKWRIFKDGRWGGPFSLEELMDIPMLYPGQWVRIAGDDRVAQACDFPELRILFSRSPEQAEESVCPFCKVALQPHHYEGVSVLKCAYCGGVFVQDARIARIIIREDYEPTEEVARLSEVIADSNKKINYQKIDPQTLWVIECPKCRQKMHRQFFVNSYPVQIDHCVSCSAVWFDKHELEAVQYIYQHKDTLLYDADEV